MDQLLKAGRQVIHEGPFGSAAHRNGDVRVACRFLDPCFVTPIRIAQEHAAAPAVAAIDVIEMIAHRQQRHEAGKRRVEAAFEPQGLVALSPASIPGKVLGRLAGR